MNPQTQHSKISVTLQVISIIAVASTFFGFLIVNIYLSIFGFWDFNFLKVQYFSAGGLFLFFISIPTLFFYIFFKAREILEKYRLINKTKLKSVLVFISKLFIFFAISLINFFVFIFPLSLSNVFYSNPGLIFLGVLWTAIIFGTVATSIKSHGEITELRHKPINLRNIVAYFSAHYRLSYILLATLALTLIFSFFVYPVVPRYFGGGKPVEVSIGFDQNFNSEQIGVSNPFNALLVYQSADSLLILTNGGTYLLKQSDIAYVKYLEGNIRMRALQDFMNLDSATTSSI